MSHHDHDDEPLDPIETLDRIIYLLDRSLADGNKVRAYSKAKEIVLEQGPDRLAELHGRNALTDLPGIGKSTGSVIADALSGHKPKKLIELEATSAIEVGEGGAIREALRGDCHLHSNWSDGGAPIEAMANAARGLGHEYMVLTDHSPRLTVAHGLNADRLRAQLDVIDELNKGYDDFRILTGIEVDILIDGSLDQDPELLDRLDVVVASVHSKLKMDEADMTKRMVRAIATGQVNILGHCTGQKVPGHMRQIGKSDFPGRAGSKFDADMIFAACKQFDVAVEINCRPERQDPPDHLLDLAIEWGCKISIDTDAHAPGQLEWQPFGCDKAACHGIEPGQIVNTFRAAELVEWAAASPG